VDDFGGGSYLELPEWDSSSFPAFGEDIWSGGGASYVDSFDPWAGMGSNDWISSYVSPEVFYPQPAQYTSGPLGIPQPQGAMNVTAPTQQQGGFLDALLKPQTLLGLAGGTSGLIGALMGGGQGATSGPRPTTAQQANMGIGNQWAQMGAQGQLPLQQQQQSLLQAIMSGQGLAQPYAAAVEQAFQPQLGDLYTQAANMGRARGFHDAPATSPPGGAILGPGLSNIQGQMASEKLKLMLGLPALLNQPIATQGNFAQNYLSAAQGAPMQQTSQAPLAPQIGQAVGQGLQGLGQVFQQQDAQAAQQKQLDSILEALRGPKFMGLSGAPTG
jgi:hypothetical protein